MKLGLFNNLLLPSSLSWIKEPNSRPTYGSCQRFWPSSSAIIRLNQVLPVLGEPNIQINCSVRGDSPVSGRLVGAPRGCSSSRGPGSSGGGSFMPLAPRAGTREFLYEFLTVLCLAAI